MKIGTTLAGSAAALLLAANSFAATMTTVGVLDPTPQGQTIVDSPANVGNPNFLVQASMSGLITTAFNNDTGGVINFDTANGWTAGSSMLSATVSYGIDQSQSLTLTRADGGNMFGPSGSSGQTPSVSGDNYLAFNSSGSPITLTFDKGLSAWGITQLNRTASRTVTMAFTLADNSVINFAPQIQDPNGNNTGALNFYGIQVTDANPITKVTITEAGGAFTRYDDMAVVVANVVPEPSSAVLVGLGLLSSCAMVRRRKMTPGEAIR